MARTNAWTRLIAAAVAATYAAPAVASSLDDDDPVAIMDAVEDRDTGDRMSAQMTMTIVSDDREKVRVVRVTAKKFDGGTKQLLVFESPADVRNTGLLMIDYKAADKSDDQWLYLPTMRKSTRISSADKSGAFMGSDFSYSDMNRPHARNFDYKMLKSSVAVGGEDCWLIEARPKTDAIRRETGYLKSHLWISKNKLMPLQIKAWVAEGKKIKLMKFGKIERIAGALIAQKSAARTLSNGRVESTTIIELRHVKFNDAAVSASDLTHRGLERGL